MASPLTDDAVVKVSDIALATGRTPETIHNWRRSGQLPPPDLTVGPAGCRTWRLGTLRQHHPEVARLVAEVLRIRGELKGGRP